MNASSNRLTLAVVYILAGAVMAILLGILYHSAARGIFVAASVVLVCILFDLLARYVVSTDPTWFLRCRMFARSLLTKRLDSDDDRWCDDYDDEPYEPLEEGDFIEGESNYITNTEIGDITPDDELNQVEDLDRGHEPELIELEHDNAPADEKVFGCPDPEQCVCRDGWGHKVWKGEQE
jgi:hypothetical protein